MPFHSNKLDTGRHYTPNILHNIFYYDYFRYVLCWWWWTTDLRVGCQANLSIRTRMKKNARQ